MNLSLIPQIALDGALATGVLPAFVRAMASQPEWMNVMIRYKGYVIIVSMLVCFL